MTFSTFKLFEQINFNQSILPTKHLQPTFRRNMKLLAVLALAGCLAIIQEIIYEPTFNLALDSRHVLFYHDYVTIDTQLTLFSTCSQMQRTRFSCETGNHRPTSHGRKTNKYLTSRQDHAVRACFRTNRMVMDALVTPSSPRERRNALLEVGKQLLTSISPLTADALAIIEPWVPKAYDAIKRAVTTHRRLKSSSVVRSNTEFQSNALEQDLCTETSLSFLSSHPDDVTGGPMEVLGQRMANSNLVQIEKMFSAIKSRNFESSDAIEDLLLRVCLYHTNNRHCQNMIDTSLLEVLPKRLLMSINGDIQFEMTIRIPRKLNTATLFTLRSNGRLLPDGTLQKLIVTDSALLVRDKFYDATNIKCSSNLEHEFCHHSALTTLGCEGRIINSGDASSCPVESSKWDTLKPRLTTTPMYTLYSSTQECTLCTDSEDSLDDNCSKLQTTEIISTTGIITCPESLTRLYHDFDDISVKRFNISAFPTTTDVATPTSMDSNLTSTLGRAIPLTAPLWLIILSTILSCLSFLHIGLSATIRLLRSLKDKKAKDTIGESDIATAPTTVTNQTTITNQTMIQQQQQFTEIKIDDETSSMAI